MFEPEVFRKQTYWIEVLATLLGLFCTHIVIRRLGHYVPFAPLVTPLSNPRRYLRTSFSDLVVPLALHKEGTKPDGRPNQATGSLIDWPLCRGCG